MASHAYFLRRFGLLLSLGIAAVVRATRLSASSGEHASTELQPKTAIAAAALPAYCSAMHVVPASPGRTHFGPHFVDFTPQLLRHAPVHAAGYVRGVGGFAQARSTQGRIGTRLQMAQHPPEIEALELFERVGKGQDGDVFRARIPADDEGKDQDGEIFPADISADEEEEEEEEVEPEPDVAVKVIKHTAAYEGEASNRKKVALTSPEYSEIRRLFTGPYFVETFNVWQEEGDDYMSMELAHGNLQSEVLDKPFEEVSLVERVALMGDLLIGLIQMDRAGFSHFDIKPSNLLIFTDTTTEHFSPRLRLKIGDLRSSRRIHPEQPLDEKSSISGSGGAGTNVDEIVASGIVDVPYAAPERLLEEPLSATDTAKGDVFSAGIIFYQLLFEGRLPLHYYENKEAWDEFDIDEDPLLEMAQELAEKMRQPWLFELLETIEAMLSDVGTRLSASEALKQINEAATKEQVIPHEGPLVLRGALKRINDECDNDAL